MPAARFLLFASDATLAATGGALLMAVALIAALAERRRGRRRRIEAVGWVPWTAIFVTASFGAVALFMVALVGWTGASPR